MLWGIGGFGQSGEYTQKDVRKNVTVPSENKGVTNRLLRKFVPPDLRDKLYDDAKRRKNMRYGSFKKLNNPA